MVSNTTILHSHQLQGSIWHASFTIYKIFRQKNKIIDYTLDQAQSLVDPAIFFRISRKYLVKIDAIEDIVAYTNSRLLLQLPHLTERDAIVSREKVNDFKQWLDR